MRLININFINFESSVTTWAAEQLEGVPKTNSTLYEIFTIQDDDRNPGGSYIYIGVQAGSQVCINSTYTQTD